MASPALKHGHFPADGAGGFPAAPVLTLGQNDLTEIVSTSLRTAFAEHVSPVKAIARAANANEKAAKDWFRGRNCPSALYLLRLMATVPMFQAEVRRLAGMHADIDPEFDAAMMQAMALFARAKGGMA